MCAYSTDLWTDISYPNQLNIWVHPFVLIWNKWINEQCGNRDYYNVNFCSSCINYNTQGQLWEIDIIVVESCTKILVGFFTDWFANCLVLGFYFGFY